MGPRTKERPTTAARWAETVNRFEFDQWMRQNGYSIVSRPNKGPTLWQKNGTTMTEAQAMTQLAKTPKVKD